MGPAAATVLAVDDEAASRRAVRRALASEFRVVEADGGAAALSVLRETPVAVIVADQRMPGMTGTELFEQCSLAVPDVIRILFTGYTDFDTLVTAINAGHVYAYVPKPWEPHDLLWSVQRAVERFAIEEDRRRLLRAVQESCAQLQAELAAKQRLLTLTAHELGTPVHLVSNAFAALPRLEPAHSIADRALTWLGRALAQLHRAGLVATSDFALDLQRHSAGAVLDAVASRYRKVAAERHLSLVVEATTDLGETDFDRAWLELAVGNLVSNAIRFTADGGRIRLSVGRGSSEVVWSVEDSGAGVEPHLVPHLFEMFSLAAGDIETHGSGAFELGSRGLGLGLAIADRVVRAHGGEIRVETAPGHGSRFEIHLPSG